LISKIIKEETFGYIDNVGKCGEVWEELEMEKRKCGFESVQNVNK